MKRTQNFHKFIESFRPLYEQTVQEQYDKLVVPFQQQHRDLFDKSVLEVINKHKEEIFHSDILSHIWKKSKSALLSFLRSIDGVDEDFIAKVADSNKYYVHREWPDKVDIFIAAEQSWVIAIENKVDSKVHNRAGTDKSQLTHYRKCVEKECPKSKFDHCFILLSHRDNTSYLENEPQWKVCSYLTLFKSLLAIENPDRITREYLSALLGLLCDKNLNPDEAKKSLHSIKQFRSLENE